MKSIQTDEGNEFHSSIILVLSPLLHSSDSNSQEFDVIFKIAIKLHFHVIVKPHFCAVYQQIK